MFLPTSFSARSRILSLMTVIDVRLLLYISTNGFLIDDLLEVEVELELELESDCDIYNLCQYFPKLTELPFQSLNLFF